MIALVPYHIAKHSAFLSFAVRTYAALTLELFVHVRMMLNKARS